MTANIWLFILLGTLPLISLYLIKLIVDTAASVGSSGTAQDAATEQVVVLIALTGAVALLGIILQSVARWVHDAQSFQVADYVYDLLHAKTIDVDLACYENPEYYNLLHRAREAGPNHSLQVISHFEVIAKNGISLLAILGLLMMFHWSMVVILLMAVIPGLIIKLYHSDKMYQWVKQCTDEERRCLYFSEVMTSNTYAKELRLFNLGSLFRTWFRQGVTKLREQRLSLTTRRAKAEVITEAGGTIAVFAAFAWVAYSAVAGTITLGDLVMYYLAFQRAQTFLWEIARGGTGLYESSRLLSDFFSFLKLEPAITTPAHSEPVPTPISQSIRVENLDFRYPSSNRPVLKNINLHIKPGEHIALVGENGSGKTSLVKLLCRLYDPDQGSISVDGINIRQFDLEQYRKQISVVFQDYAHYHLSARENIWLGNTEIASDGDEICQAARLSGADAVIRSLPSGYHALLGKDFDGGEELSIGQWQKIAIARAFLRQPQILILDEPTSALDAKAEYEVFNKYHALAKGKTAILISHRLSTVKMVDTIYVMEQGEIVEGGSHDELIARNGVYAALFEKQASHYR